MDKAFKGSQAFSAVEKFLAQVNQTTDDFLFLYDILQHQFHFFGAIDDIFAVRKPGSAISSVEELIAIVHPADRKKVQQDIEEIAAGQRVVQDLNFRMINKRGGTVWVNSRGNLIYDDEDTPSAMLGRLSEEAVRHLFNALTGLGNLNKLREDLKVRLRGGSGWLVVLKIPMLTDINLSHGRGFGNQLIRDVAEMIGTLTDVEAVYHTHPNQFAIILDTCAADTVESLYDQLSKAFHDRCTISAGAVPIEPGVFLDVPQLIDSANVTLSKADENPSRAIAFFSKEEVQQRIATLLLLEEMKESVQNGFEGFEVLYQPQIQSGNYALHGVEALLRYHTPKRGRVFPNEFIPLLEQSGLIDPVGMWVLDTALAQCKQWRESLPDLQVSVNFSSVQFEDPRLGEKIIDALERAQLPGNVLTVELTESVQLNASKHYYDLIKYIKSYGVHFSIDDFGTGYANLGYLKQLDVSEIKIDRSFVTEIEKNVYNYRLLSNIIEFARSNSISACCEGVETAQELSALEPLQADFFQGYLFDKPCSAEEIAYKYIHITSEGYVARMAALEEIHRYKAQFGSIHFDPKDILRANHIGLWILHYNKITGSYDLHVDSEMEQVLGMPKKMPPTKCYAYWHDRIAVQDMAQVDATMCRMMETHKPVQLEYRWQHPALGEVIVRSSGIRTQDNPGVTVIEGYHHILTGVEGT